MEFCSLPGADKQQKILLCKKYWFDIFVGLFYHMQKIFSACFVNEKREKRIILFIRKKNIHVFIHYLWIYNIFREKFLEKRTFSHELYWKKTVFVIQLIINGISKTMKEPLSWKQQEDYQQASYAATCWIWMLLRKMRKDKVKRI